MCVGELTQPRAIRADEIEAGTVRHRVPALRSGIGLPLIEDLEVAAAACVSASLPAKPRIAGWKALV